ncbi:MAG: HD domain-containing protein, partial [Candidatus Obscuribacterales bacterium]|nr:HD domain-containing protein [Candidatus Obscuribacterales bacterium]
MEESISKRKIVGTLRHRLVLLIDQYKPSERQLLQNALSRAEEIHEDQYRRAIIVSVKRGLPYIAHPMRVALIIMEELEVKDIVAIAGALLHDVVEAKRKKISIADIEKDFGRSIAMMVSILTRPEVEAAATEEEKR